MTWAKDERGARVWKPPKLPRAVQWRKTLALYDRWLRSSSPLRPQTRVISRWLLIAIAIGFVMDSARIVPVEVSVLGFRFESIDQARIQATAGILIGVFALSYLLRVSSDVVAWSDEHRAQLRSSKEDLAFYELHGDGDRRAEQEAIEQEVIEGIADDLVNAELALRLGSPRVIPIVALVEISAPYGLALYVIAALLRAS